jgi:uncharacterized membrane protein (DUF2068 family)
MSKRPQGLILIICYKAFSASLFIISAISIFLTLNHYEGLQDFANNLALEGKKGIITFTLNKILGISPRTLEFGGFAALGYAFVSVVEAIGLWFQKAWAKWLVIFIVGISIPPEIYELIQGLSWIKLLIFALNIVIFLYLLNDFLQERKREKQAE